MASYTIKGGDNLSKIASQYGLSWQQLWEANKGNLRSGNPNLIFPGETIQIPGSAGSSSSGSSGQTTQKTSTAPATKSAEELIREQEERTKKLIQEQFDFLKGYLEKNPFAFDEALVREASSEKYRGYYEEVLQDFVEPLQDKITRSTEDQTRILDELVRRRDLGETQKLREIEEGLEKSRQGFAGRGLFGSGLEKRATGVEEIKGNENLQDFLAKSKFEEDTTSIAGQRERADFQTDIEKKQRDVFGQGREYDTAVAKEVQEQKKTQAAKYSISAEEAYRSRFGTPYVGGNSSQYASDYIGNKYLVQENMSEQTGLPSFITDARETAQGAGQVASDFATSAITIPDRLSKVMDDVILANKDLYDIRSSSLANFLASPEKGEAKFGVQQFGTGPQAGEENPDFIWNPFERNAAIASYTATEQIPFLTSNALLGNVVGSGTKIIDSETRQFQARAAATAAAAEAARTAYSDVLNEYLSGQDLRIKNEQLDIQKKELALKQAASGRESKADPYKQNEALVGIVAQAQATLAAKQQNGTVTTADVDAVFNALAPQFERIGIPASEVDFWKQQAYTEYVPTDSGSGSNFFQKAGQVISDYFLPSEADKQAIIDKYGVKDQQTGSFLKNANSTLQNFLGNFNFGGGSSGGAQ